MDGSFKLQNKLGCTSKLRAKWLGFLFKISFYLLRILFKLEHLLFEKPSKNDCVVALKITNVSCGLLKKLIKISICMT